MADDDPRAARAAPDPTAAQVALFLRGDAASHLSRIDALDADALVVDLEDAVDATAKDGARRLVRAHLEHRAPGRPLWVRVAAAAEGTLDLDLEAALWPAVTAVVLAKVVRRADLDLLDAALSRWERRRGLDAGSTGVVALVETAAGVVGLAGTLAGPHRRALRLALGPADYAADLGVENTAGSPAIEHARAALVLHSAAAGLPAPLDGPWMVLGDAAGLAADSAGSRAHGFGGRLAIHPGQVAAVRRAYGAPPGLERARAVVAAWEERPAGAGALRVDDEFVDAPVYAAALRLLGRTS